MQNTRLLSQQQENHKLQHRVSELSNELESTKKELVSAIRGSSDLRRQLDCSEKEVQELKQMLHSVRHNSKQSLIKLEEQTSKEAQNVKQLVDTIAEKNGRIALLERQLAENQQERVDETLKLMEEAKWSAKLQESEAVKSQLAMELSRVENERDLLLKDKEKLKLQVESWKATSMDSTSTLLQIEKQACSVCNGWLCLMLIGDILGNWTSKKASRYA